jgi:GTP-binding protein
MIIKRAEFVAGASKLEMIPKLEFPEIAFAGRSNVGKSSLLNSIIMRKNLAQTSSNPGKTRQINFYSVEDKWTLVDLPGYGYAAVSKTDRKYWADMSSTYFNSRENLKLICLLVDSRHDPMDTDLAMMEWLENNAKKFLVIMTKCDKISKTQIADRKKQLEGFLQFCSHNLEVLPYSSVDGTGRTELIAIIKKCVSDRL